MIELINVYEKFGNGYTYTTPCGVAKIKQGKKYVYAIPYGEDYECEGGHYIEIITEEEFNNKYSLIPREYKSHD